MLYLSFLGEAHAATGCREEAEKILDRLQEFAKEQYVTPYFLARAYTALGKKEKALTFLEMGYREKAPLMVWLKVDSLLDSLRPEPRFQDLLRRMNFPEV